MVQGRHEFQLSCDGDRVAVADITIRCGTPGSEGGPHLSIVGLTLIERLGDYLVGYLYA